MRRSAHLLTLLAACASAPAPRVRPGTSDAVNIVKARADGARRQFEWAAWSPEAFARAAREGRFVLIDGAAEWCHWCHVMDETTYRDPEVARVLRERFVAIRVDIDERPDIAERYGDWGWPATVILSPQAEELGKFRGYLPPERLHEILAEVTAATPAAEAPAVPLPPAQVAALPWIAARAMRDLDDFYDDDQGSWGRRLKTPIGLNLVFELRRAARGDAAARRRATFTLEQQRALLDPVWGGIYQYSTGGKWDEPHFEKLISYQAPNLEAYARGYATTGDPALLADARAIARYLDEFLSAPDGGFYVNQDADVGAHERDAARFVDGHVYYARDDAGRRALGIPWIDTHVYARENGMAIAALCALAEASGDPAPILRARRAADRVLRTHVETDGAVWHDGERRVGPLFLGDAAWLGLGLARLAEATGDADLRARAVAVAAALERALLDPETGAFWAHTPDRNAVGVFARIRRPFEENVTAARFLAALARLTGERAYRERAERVLAAVAMPDALDHQGPWLGDLLLALDDVGALPRLD